MAAIKVTKDKDSIYFIQIKHRFELVTCVFHNKVSGLVADNL